MIKFNLHKIFRYQPWKGFLLWLGNIPVGIWMINYELMNREIFAQIHGMCFVVALLWSTTYEGNKYP